MNERVELCAVEIMIRGLYADGRSTGWLCHFAKGHDGPHEGLADGYPEHLGPQYLNPRQDPATR